MVRKLLKPGEKYGETGELLRHYSSIRSAIISFTVPAIMGMGAFVLANLQRIPLVAYLLVTELLLFVSMAFLSAYLSRHIYVLRDCMLKMESDFDASPYNAMQKIAIMKAAKLDVFDRVFIGIGVVFHLGFYGYLLLQLL